MKVRKKLIAFLCLVLFLGILAGGAIYYFVFMPNPENTQLRSVGVITPEAVGIRPTLTWSNDELELWSDGGSNLTDTVEAALASGIRLFPSDNSSAAKLKVVVLPSISMSAITEQTGVFVQKDVAIYSGSFVYLPAEASLLLRNPDRLMDNLVAGLQYASAFKSTATKEGTVYDINASGLLTSYVSAVTSSQQGQPNSTITTTNNWVSPYPEKTSQYAKISEVCFEIGSYLELMLCESALQQNGNQSLIPPKSSEFFESRGLQNFSSFKALSRLTPSEVNTKLNALNLTASKIKFNNWGFTDLEEASYLISNDGYFKNLSQDNLNLVKSAISELGFELAEESPKNPNTQFGGQSNYLKYRKNTPIGDILVSIRVLDTATLSTDCIVEGVGELFCTDDAIGKESGLFIQVVVGEKLKYA